MTHKQTTVSIESYRSFTMSQIESVRQTLELFETAIQSNDKAMIIRIFNMLTNWIKQQK